MKTYVVAPERGKPFELEAEDAVAAIAQVNERLGEGTPYAIRRADAVMPVPFGRVTENGSILL
jgi:hypothetical protein